VLLEATAPRFAVISTGRDNRFGLPAPSVVADWTDGGARVLRTDEYGAIIFHSDGDSLSLIRP
jgi:competence protein ComEC